MKERSIVHKEESYCRTKPILIKTKLTKVLTSDLQMRRET